MGKILTFAPRADSDDEAAIQPLVQAARKRDENMQRAHTWFIRAKA